MRQAVEDFSALAGASAGAPLRLAMRIGVNTGPVVFGAVGTTAEFTAMGDAVNLAARLEAAAPVGEILISHDIYRHVRGLFDVQPLGPMNVKGKAEPVQTYIIQRAKRPPVPVHRDPKGSGRVRPGSSCDHQEMVGLGRFELPTSLNRAQLEKPYSRATVRYASANVNFADATMPSGAPLKRRWNSLIR